MASPRMTEEEIWAYVEQGHTGILTTLTRSGEPIALPLWYVTIDKAVYMTSRGKKLKRIRHDSRASFLVESGLKWAELKSVHIAGRAELLDPSDPVIDEFRRLSDEKYRDFRTAATAMPKATADHYQTAETAVIRVVPTGKILNWDNTKLMG